MGIDEILGQIKRPERTVPICLRGDLAAVYEQLGRDFEVADTTVTDDVLAGGSSTEAAKLAAEMASIRQQMLDVTEIFVLRALPRSEWVELAREHPARDGIDLGDVNEDTFIPALVAACAITPAMTVEQATILHRTLSEGQWGAIATAVWDLNRSLPEIPFNLAASARTGLL
jgi:hypothetical protein